MATQSKQNLSLELSSSHSCQQLFLYGPGQFLMGSEVQPHHQAQHAAGCAMEMNILCLQKSLDTEIAEHHVLYS